ncbi:DegT/DnrJ/EryC1/StrS family aminotransferase [Micromonospora sp. NBC_01412]|uniref:DegT/DnrJ/EryC1/StrS family aminotransferase n=1 Tax=Micromonospora sp. NBC_01412 TaxID=2903590 RepID=UPI003247F656
MDLEDAGRSWVVDHVLGPAEIDAAVRVLTSRTITTGPEVRLFERELADRFGVPDVLALGSCTAAMHLALIASDIGPGDEVVTTPLTFPATANVILAVGATPVFADIDPITLNMDPESVAAAVTPRTRAVMPVHLGGAACDLIGLKSVADRFGLTVVADCAHAVDCHVDGLHVARAADISCFSFYATKNITSVEGGALVAGPDVLARARLLARHGLDFTWGGAMTATAAGYTPREVGYKYNLSDLHAAIGRVQLGRMDSLQATRRAAVAVYDDLLRDLPGVALPARTSTADHGWYLYQLRLAGTDGAAVASRREHVRRELAAAGIATGAYYRPLHQYELYQRTARIGPGGLAAAEDAYPRLLALPLHGRLTTVEAAVIGEAVIAALGTAP